MGGKRAVALIVDQVIREAYSGRNLDHVEAAVYPVFLDLVFTALGNGDLRLKRRIILIARSGGR